MKKIYADLLLISVAAVWGMTFSIVQDALEFIGVYAFLFWRFFIAFIVMIFICSKNWQFVTKEIIIKGCILGILIFLSFGFQTFALLYTKSSTVAFITGLNVVIVPFFLFFIFKVQIKKIVFLSCIIALIGLYLLTIKDNKLIVGYGEFLTFICAIFISLHLIFTDTYSKQYNINLLVFVQFTIVMLFSFWGAFLIEDSIFKIDWFMNTNIVKALLITSLLGTVYGFWIQTSVQKYTTPTKTAIIFTTEPVFAFLYSYFFDNENFTNIQISGYILIILAMLITEIKWSTVIKK